MKLLTGGSDLSVRPSHLFVGTALENVHDMMAKGRGRRDMQTHCKNGHPLVAPNLVPRPKARVCKTCFYAYQKRWRAERRAARKVA